MTEQQDSAPPSVEVFQKVLFLGQHLRYLFDRRLASDGLSTAQAMALSIASRPSRSGPPSLSELADELGSSHQNVAALMRGLTDRGFVRIEADTHDRRVRRVVVSPKSIDYWRARDAEDFAFIDALFGDMTTEQQRNLAIVLDGLLDSVMSAYWQTRRSTPNSTA